jgi:hypothetical protein
VRHHEAVLESVLPEVWRRRTREGVGGTVFGWGRGGARENVHDAHCRNLAGSLGRDVVDGPGQVDGGEELEGSAGLLV